jgi:acetamidase/formamidase
MGRDARDVQVAAEPNPQTGPFYVEGAAADDTLILHLDRLVPNRATGESDVMPAPNVVDPDSISSMPGTSYRKGRKDIRWRIDQEAGTATLIEPEGKLGQLSLPLAPMLGCFGVAPPGGQAISTMTSGQHGGNMDYRGFVSEVTVCFPVFVPGALLFVGDGHALQGDGEISGTGIEISFEVQFTVNVIKGKKIHWPRGENGAYIFTVGNARPLDQAVQHATTEMLRCLQEDFGLSVREASLLLSYCVEYDLGNMFDPAYTMVCKIPKQFLPERI